MTEENDRLISTTVSNLRFPLIVMVVAAPGILAVYLLLLVLDVTGSTPGDYSTPWHGLGIIAGAVSVVFIAGLLTARRGWKVPERLSASAFFIFCFHYYICQYLTHPLYACLQPQGGLFIVMYVADIAVVTALSYACCRIVARYFPRLGRLFTGSRL